MGTNYSYPDKLGFAETIMFHVRAMSHELAEDGLVDEYEDMVDALAWKVWVYMTPDEVAEYEKWDEHEVDISKTDERGWGRAKRKRCKEKELIIFKVLDRHDILLRKIPDFDFEGDYLDLPVNLTGNKGGSE